MLRAAATLLALLAAVPAVTPLLGGYKVFSECRNLTHLGPGQQWPDLPSKPYTYTGILVMPEETCSGTLVTFKFVLSSSMCRLGKVCEGFKFDQDVESEDSEVRIGIIQGDVPDHLYERQAVKQYIHFGKTEEEVRENPVMLVEVEEPFCNVTADNIFPGIFCDTPLSKEDVAFLLADIVGYENSANVPIYHQSVFDAHLYSYHLCCKQYGRTVYNISEAALCTWDVSPVRTVCCIDRGGPVMFKRNILAIVVGIVDDLETQGAYCGEGRIHYNVFLQLSKYTDWIKKQTGNEAKIVNLVDGKVVEEGDEETATGARPAQPTKPAAPRPPKKKPQPGRSGAENHLPSVWLLLLPAVATVARLLFQY